MLDPQAGSITLDDIDIAQMPHDVLRERCFVTVSQDALLLPHETLRFNLVGGDDSLSNHALISALQRVKLWTYIAGGSNSNERQTQESSPLPQHNATVECIADGHDRKHHFLDATLSTLPTLSAGQAQLFALCRGMLKAEALRARGILPVVLLDEVTAALDVAADEAVQAIVEREFSGRGHTVIMVSHRLGSAQRVANREAGRDVVVWMADGRVERIDGPS